MMKTPGWSGFFSSVSASSPSRSCHDTPPVDFSCPCAGRKNVTTVAIIHTTAPLYPANAELSAANALIVQQPAIHPSVAVARIGPNSLPASARREKMIVEAKLKVGAEQSACI